MNATEPRLRVGLLCDGPVLQRWQAECLRHVLAVDGVDLVLVVRPTPTRPAPRSLGQRLLRHPWRIALYLRYRRKHFRPAAMAPEDVSALLRDVPAIECTVERRGHGQYFSAEDIARIRTHRPDMLLRFGLTSCGATCWRWPPTGCGASTTAMRSTTAAARRASGNCCAANR